MNNLFEMRPKNTRSICLAVYIGIIAGVISAFVKSGFEDVVPPRSMDVVPPPVMLLEKLGFHVDSMTYHWMDYTINWGGNGVHILFSIGVAIIYCVLTEYFIKVRLFHGIAFGVAVSVFAHGLIVPLLGLSHWLWLSGYEAIISEFIGTGFWIWTIEAIRQNLRFSLVENRS